VKFRGKNVAISFDTALMSESDENHFRPPMNADKSFVFNPRLWAFIGGHRVRNDFFKILMTVSLHKCLQTSNDLFAGANAH
jgi:hypothetical protein